MGADKWAQVNDPAWYGSRWRRATPRSPRCRVCSVVPASRLRHRGRGDPRRPGRPRATCPRARRRAGARPPRRAAAAAPHRRRDERHRQPPRRLVARPRRRGAPVDRRAAGVRRAHAATAIAVVLDGRPLPDFPEGVHDGVLVAYARRGGRDAADDRIVEEVERDRDPSSLVGRDVGSGPAGPGARARCAASKARRSCSAIWNREVRDVVVALDAERVERHRHEVVLPDGEHEVEQLLLVVVLGDGASTSRRTCTSRRAARRPRAGAARRTDPNPVRRARRRCGRSRRR